MGVINTTTNKNSTNIDQNFPIPRLTTDFAPLQLGSHTQSVDLCIEFNKCWWAWIVLTIKGCCQYTQYTLKKPSWWQLVFHFQNENFCIVFLLHSGIMHWILFKKSMSLESEALLRMPSSNTINALQATHTSTILFYLTVCLLNIIHLSGKHQMCYSCKLLIELPTSQSVCISIAINGCRQYDQKSS